MKAIVFDEYGAPEVLRVADVPAPQPGEGEVRIRIAAATVNMGDCEMRRTEVPNSIWVLVRLVFGWRKPRKRVLGAYTSRAPWMRSGPASSACGQGTR